MVLFIAVYICVALDLSLPRIEKETFSHSWLVCGDTLIIDMELYDYLKKYFKSDQH